MLYNSSAILSPNLLSGMFDTVQRNVAAFARDVMIPNRTHFTVGANQILGGLNSVRESDVLEREHIVHQPVVCVRFGFQFRVGLFVLLMHQR